MKYHSILQHSEEDCGAASLATVAKHYGRTFAMNRVREAVGTGSRGTTLLGLRRGAETLGFHARQVQATPELLEKLNEARKCWVSFLNPTYANLFFWLN